MRTSEPLFDADFNTVEPVLRGHDLWDKEKVVF
jgi:hypothetical protein